MEQKFCQSCGMPLNVAADHGTNADKSINDDYCTYCFQDGNFTQQLTMNEMINHCAQFVDEFNKSSEKKLSKDEAIAQMKEYFPHLKRWKEA